MRALSHEWVPGAVASVCAAMDRLELVATCDLKPELVDAEEDAERDAGGECAVMVNAPCNAIELLTGAIV